MNNEIPHYELTRVYEDGSSESPEIVPLLQLPLSTKMNRRGFLGTGLTVSSVLGLSVCNVGSEPAYAEPGKAEEPRNIAGKCDNKINAHASSVMSLAFSIDGKWLASGSNDKTVKLWEMPSGKLVATLRRHTEPVKCVCFSPDGKWLVSASEDKTIKLWKMPSRKLTLTLEGHTGQVNTIAFSPDGKWMASGSADNTVKLWEMFSGKLAANIARHTSEVISIAFSPDGKWLASASSASSQGNEDDKTIMLWDMPSLSLASTFQAGDIQSISFSSDGKFLVSGSNDSTIKFWEIRTGNLIVTLPNQIGRLKSRVLEMWEILSGQAAPTSMPGHIKDVNSIFFSADGKWLASGSDDKTIIVWEMPSIKLKTTLQGHTASINSVAISPDSQWLASGSGDNSVMLWQMPSGKYETCLFDPAALEKGDKAIQYTAKNATGQHIIYSLPCGSAIPKGATCTCNCVLGTYSPPQPERSRSGGGGSWGGGGGGGYHCTCNRVCTCIPVCQAHKVLDSDPIIRVMAEESLLIMGEREFDYMHWASQTAPESVSYRIHEMIHQIKSGAKPDPSRWPSMQQCLRRLDHHDEVVSLMAAQFLHWLEDREGTVDTTTRIKAADALQRGAVLHRQTQQKVKDFIGG